MTVTQWEYTYLQVGINAMGGVIDEANKLGAVGWEVVGFATADRSFGADTNVLVLKRAIRSVPLPPPPTATDEWLPDPTGRYDMRRWDSTLQVWTAETATMSTETTHVDPPHAVRPAR